MTREALAAALAHYNAARSVPGWATPMVAAARELLAGQKVWWCLEHKVNGTEANCWALYHPLFDPDSDPPCRMVEAVLVIPDEKET